MDEQRLIDANALLDKQESLYMKGHVLFHGVTAYAIENAPTIDPESLPVVQKLQAELWKAKAERDAAVKNRAKLAEYELTVCEEFCCGDAQHDIPPCEWLVDGKCALREWVKEYA